jgi:dipeptidyl aminopeptidase/acylaminoacyl peptidase
VIALFAVLLVALGFIVGFGFHTMQRPPHGNTDDEASGPPVAPIVRGLRIAPNDKLLAFTAVYDASQRASRFVFDIANARYSAVESPRGWQDYISQWSADSRRILFEREKIPRPVEEARAGMYEESMGGDADSLKRETPNPLTEQLALPDEAITTGTWTPDNRLVLRTRHEAKSLFLEDSDGKATLIDRSLGTYYQNREVKEQGQLAFYVVRDVTSHGGVAALYRVVNGKAAKLSENLDKITWAYLSENARWLVVCRQAAAGEGWEWTLYQVTPLRATPVKTAWIPADVIAVYWSPDFKRILGASGKSLWLIDIPSLKVSQLGKRDDWNADDAAWLNHQNAIIVAANGTLWHVEVPSGKESQLWKFPASYWK